MKYIGYICILNLLLSCNHSARHEGAAFPPPDAENQVKENITAVKNASDSIPAQALDSMKLKQSYAVILATLQSKGPGDKFLFDTVKVLKVLYNKASYDLTKPLVVASYSFDAGVPAGKKCILYLQPFPLGAATLDKEGRWMLLKGVAKEGVEIKQ